MREFGVEVVVMQEFGVEVVVMRESGEAAPAAAAEEVAHPPALRPGVLLSRVVAREANHSGSAC